MFGQQRRYKAGDESAGFGLRDATASAATSSTPVGFYLFVSVDEVAHSVEFSSRYPPTRGLVDVRLARAAGPGEVVACEDSVRHTFVPTRWAHGDEEGGRERIEGGVHGGPGSL